MRAFLVVFSQLWIFNICEGKSLYLKLSPEEPAVHGYRFSMHLRQTDDGTVARVGIRSPKGFPDDVSTRIFEITSSGQTFSSKPLKEVMHRNFGNALSAEFLLTPELVESPDAAFVFRASPVSLDHYWLPLKDFLPQLSITYPELDSEWTMRDEGESNSYRWANFDNAETGDVLAFQTWQVHSKIDLLSSPVLQASIETFRSDGSARNSIRKKGLPIQEILRWQITEVNFGKQVVDAIEYTYLYGESATHKSASIGHGYIVLFDNVVYFVQHTSKTLISSETVLDVLAHILAKKHPGFSWSKGESRKIDR